MYYRPPAPILYPSRILVYLTCKTLLIYLTLFESSPSYTLSFQRMETIAPSLHTAQMYLMLKRAEVLTEDDYTQYNHNIALDSIKSLILTNHVAIPYLICVGKCISELSSLSLERCDFGDEGALSLSLIFSNLKRLSVRVNLIGVKGVQAICSNLPNIEQLNLGFNNINDQCGALIAHKLKKVKTLNLQRNQIGDVGVLKVWKNLKALTIFNIDFTNTSRKTRQQIVKQLKSSRAL